MTACNWVVDHGGLILNRIIEELKGWAELLAAEDSFLQNPCSL